MFVLEEIVRGNGKVSETVELVRNVAPCAAEDSYGGSESDSGFNSFLIGLPHLVPIAIGARRRSYKDG